MRRFQLAISVAVSAWLVCAVSAFAARGEGERVGESLGELLGGWAKNLYLGIAGLVALMFLLNRRFADLFVMAATVVGGFVMAPSEVASTLRDIWQTVTD